MIGVLGINHKTASLNIRDKFSITQEDIIPLSETLLLNQNITGVVVLATCNRTEIYFAFDKKGDPDVVIKDYILKKIHDFLGFDTDYSNHFYYHMQSEAIRHLFEVTSGIDSMVIGENQIVNQMKKAYLFATEANLTDAVLMRLFQKSFECSKRVRTETAIQQGATSVGYVAIDMCSRLFSKFSDKSILIVGAGETGELTIRGLKKRGVSDIYITNRTDKKALDVAEKNGVTPVLFNNYKEQLYKFDIVVTATDAGRYLIDQNDVEVAMELRDQQQQVYIDLSVPRNIDVEIQEIENADVYCVDDFQKILEEHKDMREQSIERASEIIQDLVADSLSWLNSRSLRPVINTITNSMEELSKTELAEYRKDLGEDACAQLEKYTGLLTQKYIRNLIRNLKEVTDNGSSTVSLDAINQLFKFDN